MADCWLGYAALSYNLGASLRSGFNGLLAGKLLAVVDEIDEGASGRRYQMQQDLKQLITEETRAITRAVLSPSGRAVQRPWDENLAYLRDCYVIADHTQFR